MLNHWGDPANVIAIVGVIIQVALFGAVIWYTVETRRLVTAAQEQIKVSNHEVEAGLMQVEALQTPFIILPDGARTPDDAIRSADGIVGDRVIMQDAPYLGVQNIGAHALDIEVTIIEEQGQATVQPIHHRHIAFLPHSVKIYTSYNISAMKARCCDIEICYSSVSGQRYESRFVTRNLVITKTSFRRLTRRPLGL